VSLKASVPRSSIVYEIWWDELQYWVELLMYTLHKLYWWIRIGNRTKKTRSQLSMNVGIYLDCSFCLQNKNLKEGKLEKATFFSRSSSVNKRNTRLTPGVQIDSKSYILQGGSNYRFYCISIELGGYRQGTV